MPSNQNNMPDPPVPPEKHFESEVGKKEERKIKARKGPGFNIWFGLGMMGLIGWSVSVPMLIGIAIGVWLDATLHTRYSWTLMCLFIGVVLGCLNAWFWIKRQGGQP